MDEEKKAPELEDIEDDELKDVSGGHAAMAPIKPDFSGDDVPELPGIPGGSQDKSKQKSRAKR